MSIKERVILFINYLEIGQTAFEKHVGLSNGYINNIKKAFGVEKLEKILCKYPELNKDWLLTGEGEMLNTPKETIQINQEIGTPYYDVDFTCGFELIENDQTLVPAGYINIKKYDRVQMWINATGDSMKPLINNGDIIGIREVNKIDGVLGGEIYAIVTEDFRTIKIIRKTQDEEIYKFVPINKEEFDDELVNRNKILRVYQVLGCVKLLG